MINARLQDFVCFVCFVVTFETLMVAPTNCVAVEPVDFEREIRPILANHCFQCHGPDEGARQADLRLDVRDVATLALDSGDVAIVPGDPEASQLLLRVTADDPDLIMPPADHGNPLDAAQIDLLQRWISAGAPYAVHWAFVAPVLPAVPGGMGIPTRPADAAGTGRKTHPTVKIHNPIDAFVAARLARDGLAMSPPAEPAVLCRRIYLDLIGLPPTPSEVDEFVAAAAADLATAVESLIDRLLDSESYGEKWARHWLDVARYADSNGYEKDMPREQWAWRDWVIRALNADMPYNQFLVEQIAGDLLPNRIQDQLVATGFLRNGMINEEGAILAEEFRMEGMFDRMDCIGKAVLGLSLQCAQCHSHKYDPISHDEYYEMFAFLNDTCESQSQVYTAEQRAKIAELRAAILEIDNRCREMLLAGSDKAEYAARMAAWEQAQAAARPDWKILDTEEQVWVGGVNHPDELPDHSVMVLGHPSVRGEMYVIATPGLDGVTGLRLEALTHGDLPYGGPGRSSKRGTFTISELRAEFRPAGADAWQELKLQNATADYSMDDHTLPGEEDKEEDAKRRAGPVVFLIDGKKQTGWTSDRGAGRSNTESVAVLQFAEPADFPEGTELKVSLDFQHSRPGDAVQLEMLGRMRFALTTSPDPSAPGYDHAAALALQTLVADRTAAQQASVVSAWWQSLPELNALRDEVVSLWQEYPDQTTSVLTLTARTPDYRRSTFLLDRGIWNRPKREVRPQVPTVLHTLDKVGEDGGDPDPEDDLTRLDFARWLADRRSPLTARVQVNRVWLAIFGAGLVETPEDFGTRADRPEYPGVLDWLAVQFMDQGWSTKRLIRTILGSVTYQQSSRATQQLLDIDPRNRLLARGPRFRAEAEVVRDIVLTVSGLLHRELGGPSIFPPVPDSVLEDTFTKLKWDTAQGPQRYRRAIYMFRRRSMPDPGLASFDAPNADVACARRVRSNTPMASLVALNEPIFVEAARALALRILREGGPDDTARVDFAYRLCTGRGARPAEQEEILALLEHHRVRLAEGWLSINEIATGDPAQRAEIPEDTTPQDAAAWTITARVLLNLDETVSKN